MDDLQKFMAKIDNQKNLFDSAIGWLITSVFITITPTFLIWFFRTISDEKNIPISEYLDDTLLIVITLSCSLLTLLYDKNKLIEIKYKKIAFPISWAFAIVSICYYSYLSAKDIFKNKYNNQTMIILVFIIIICGAIGCICEHRHETNSKKLENLIKKEFDKKNKEIKKLKKAKNKKIK